MRWLFAGLLLLGCDGDVTTFGEIGSPCFPNGTCRGSATCISWKKGRDNQTVCAAPQDIAIGAFQLTQCKAECPELKCPEPQAVQCPELHFTPPKCPSAPAPQKCPPPATCPKMPEGPCPEIKACEPGWKRPK